MEFNFDEYPTLLRMLEGDQFFKVCIGPAGCVPGDTEVMTAIGWMRLDELTDAQAAQGTLIYDPRSEKARFEPAEVVRAQSTGFTSFGSPNGWAINMRVSEGHKIWGKTRYIQQTNPSQWVVRTAGSIAERIANGDDVPLKIPCVFNLDTPVPDGLRATAAAMALVLILAMRRHNVRFLDGDTVCFNGLTSVRKATLYKLAQSAPQFMQVHEQRVDEVVCMTLLGTTAQVVRLTNPPQQDYLRALWFMVHSNAAATPGVAEWIGEWFQTARTETFGVSLRLTDPGLAALIQYAFVSTGRACRATVDKQGTRLSCGVAGAGSWPDLRSAKDIVTEEPMPGELMYCLTTSTGMFVMRQGGRIMCTGNSAKTTGAVAMAMYDAMTQVPDKLGRRLTRTVVVRQTYTQLAGNTAKSIRALLGGIGGEVTEGKPPRGHLELPLPDGTRMVWDLQFLALDSTNVLDDIRGLDVTNAIVDELSSIDDPEVVLALLSRLGRFPSKLLVPEGPTNVRAWGITNGPTKGTWLHKWWQGKMAEKFAVIEVQIAQQTGKQQPFFGKYQQPPALLIQPDGTHLPNPKAENIKNLPNGYGYYYLQLARDLASIQAYVYGDFADLEVGTRIFKAYGQIHVLEQAKFAAMWQGARVMKMSFDFGRTPVVLLAVERSTGGLIVFDEIMAEDISIDNFASNHVLPTLARKYPGVEIGEVVGDPSGFDKGSVVNLSPFDVLHSKGIPIELPRGQRDDPLSLRIEATRQRLTTLDYTGTPMLQITDNCVMLHEALSQTYVYKEVTRSGGSISEEPTKSHKNWCSDLADALQYLCFHTAEGLERADPFMAMSQAINPVLPSRPMLGG